MMMNRYLLTLLSSGILWISCSSNASTSLNVEGLEGDVEDNVETYLSSISEDDYSTSLRFQSRLKETITEALNALGYYHPVIHFSVHEGEGDDELKVHIVQGPATRYNDIDIVVSGEAESELEIEQLLHDSALKEGNTLNHDDYESLKSALRSFGLQNGYFEGRYTLSRLEVIPETNQANVRLHYDSGPRYHFGPATITGSQIDDTRVHSLQPYKEGEAYQVSLVGQHNQNLSNTDWFSSVFVEPDLSGVGTGPAIVPVNVSLAPQARNQIETGIGVSTDAGVRGTLKWNKPWVNRNGHSFDSSLSISQPEQIITAGYKIPLEDVLRDYYRVQYGMKNLDNRDTKSLESNLTVERHWIFDSGWHRTVFLRLLAENYEQGIQDDTGQMLMPGVTYSRTKLSSGSMPNWGNKTNLTIEGGSASALSEADVLRIQGQLAWIRGIGDNHRGILMLDGGANITDDFLKLPPSLRFFAGGDNSIRGYSFESISPEDQTGALTGGQYLATSTLEYQYRLYGDWWGALFFDYGDAFTDSPEWKSGVGAGIRWASPVGPVSLDFAFGLDEESSSDQFQIHFSLGPEL